MEIFTNFVSLNYAESALPTLHNGNIMINTISHTALIITDLQKFGGGYFSHFVSVNSRDAICCAGADCMLLPQAWQQGVAVGRSRAVGTMAICLEPQKIK